MPMVMMSQHQLERVNKMLSDLVVARSLVRPLLKSIAGMFLRISLTDLGVGTA